MKIIISGILLLMSGLTHAQGTGVGVVVADSGKYEFKEQSRQATPDYTNAYRILSNQVKQKPNNAELHYFLGYTIDRMSMSDGGQMASVKKDMVLRASEQFEAVNRMQPNYKGELLTLDPYSKISSVWGSLAEAYQVKGLKDSALWAFKEGKKRGGFLDPVLEYNRQMLNSCAKNAILLTYGDNITFPVWYLQTVEKYRTDINVVDVNLINTGWYAKHLKNVDHLKMSYNDAQLDSIDYISWDAQQVTIVNPRDNSQRLSWELKPTYMGAYVLKGDRILLDILKENYFRREVYFPSTSDSSYNLFLDNQLLDDGLVARLTNLPPAEEGDDVVISPNLDKYSIQQMSTADIKKSRDVVFLLNGYRWAYYNSIYKLLSVDDKKQARALVVKMQQKFRKDKLPFTSPERERYFIELDGLTK